ncbi:MAG: hypothetical protein RL153_273, partial [Verrucomicrobiota bacterium]
MVAAVGPSDLEAFDATGGAESEVDGQLALGEVAAGGHDVARQDAPVDACADPCADGSRVAGA